MTTTAAPVTRTASCGCTITGRHVQAGPACPVRIAYRNGELTGSQITRHGNKVAKEAK